MNSLITYFPDLNENQISKFKDLENLLKEWNSKINLISRKDMDNIFIHHILHSLSIAKFIDFNKGEKIMDLGSGGGLPGIPLAIFFPQAEFTLADRTGKKIMVSSEIAKALNLENVKTFHGDANDIDAKFDYITARGVMPQKDLIKIAKRKISHGSQNIIPNGLITLKGGDLNDELKGIKEPIKIVELKDYFNEPFFETKKLIYTDLSN